MNSQSGNLVVVAQPVDEAADVMADHLLAADYFAPARLDGLADDALERVNIVEEDAVQIVHGGFHVAWHRQVDDEKRTPRSRLHHGCELIVPDACIAIKATMNTRNGEKGFVIERAKRL